MKKYFTKYLPVEGEIKKGDWAIDCENRIFQSKGKYSDKRDTKVKLFLCSRDIQVGDKYLTAPDYTKERTCEDNSYSFEHCLKVIGEISPQCLGYTKEGEEFDENEVTQDKDGWWPLMNLQNKES